MDLEARKPKIRRLNWEKALCYNQLVAEHRREVAHMEETKYKEKPHSVTTNSHGSSFSLLGVRNNSFQEGASIPSWGQIFHYPNPF